MSCYILYFSVPTWPIWHSEHLFHWFLWEWRYFNLSFLNFLFPYYFHNSRPLYLPSCILSWRNFPRKQYNTFRGYLHLRIIWNVSQKTFQEIIDLLSNINKILAVFIRWGYLVFFALAKLNHLWEKKYMLGSCNFICCIMEKEFIICNFIFHLDEFISRCQLFWLLLVLKFL